jgi:hypothetical protein
MDPRHNISATEKPLELPIVLTIRKEGGETAWRGKASKQGAVRTIPGPAS